MISLKRTSLSSAPFWASLMVIFALALFVGILWGINEYQTYGASIDNIEQNYKELYRKRVAEEVDNVLSFIEQRRSHADLRVEDELRTKVQSAYTIASHIYQMEREKKSVEQLRFMVAEILRPIRWNNGRGYYFSGRLSEGVVDLFAEDPFLEGHKVEDLGHQGFVTADEEIARILREEGAGSYRNPMVIDTLEHSHFPEVVFVKYFMPFDWYIGAGTSNKAMQDKLQEEILAVIQEIRFGEDGHILCFRTDGTLLSHPNRRYVGRSVSDLTSSQGEKYGEMMWQKAGSHGENSYLQYTTVEGGSGKLQQRLCVVKYYPPWNWALVADMSMDAMEKAIRDETLTYTSISFKNVFIFIGLFALAVLFLLTMAYFYSTKIKHGISLFTDFFRKAAHTQVKISDTDLLFSEFEDLGKLANTMVDDIVEKERILLRNELRLDTLLQLGNMEEYKISDKYDFVLHRIVQITGSACGYIALVNSSQTYTTLCSRVTDDSDRFASDGEVSSVPRNLSDSGLIGQCIANKNTVIDNECLNCSGYPYSHVVERRVDVPIISKDKIALVAGVCDSDTNYDNYDVRQMTMLLEGLWLHILKKCSEQEMAKLERQVIAISEEERSKIGRDLHDDLGSHLSGVDLLSKVLQQKLEKSSAPEARSLANIRKLIKESIEKTRALSRGLYPVHVIENGLEAALEELLVEIGQIYTVQCSLSFGDDVEPLPANIAPHVYYIIREAMFNAGRHARPQTITVEVLRSDDMLTVSIIDDGRGMEQEMGTRGLGLHTMQYRAKAISAALDIRPGEKGGTVVTLSGEVYS